MGRRCNITDYWNALMSYLAFELHAEFLHDAYGGGVRGLRYGYYARQAHAREAVVKSHSRGFGCQPLTPVGSRQPPSDFDVFGFRQRLHAAEPDQLASCLGNQFPEAELPLAKQRALPVYELPGALFRPRHAFADIAHHFRIGGDVAELLPIAGLPFGKNQALRF